MEVMKRGCLTLISSFQGLELRFKEHLGALNVTDNVKS